jgi:hypothetical protein
VNAALVIAQREILERRRLFVIAAAIAVLPFLVALVPGASGQRNEAIILIAGLATIAFSCGLALMLGISAIGRDLSERRLSFYFARPVSVASIWFGKLTGAVILASLIALIIGLPAFLSAPDAWHTAWSDPGGLLTTIPPAILVLFLLGHAGSTLARSRSGWLGLDLVLAAFSALALYGLVRTLAFHGAEPAMRAAGWALAGVALLVATVAPVWQLARGRTDTRRNHLAFSQAVWTPIAVALLVAAAIAWWVVRPPLQAIQDPFIVQGRSWALVGGSAPASRGGATTSFLVDPATDAAVRVGPTLAVSFSDDGRTAAWAARAGLSLTTDSLQIYARRLGETETQPVASLDASNDGRYELSPDGARVAVVDREQLRVHDVRTRTVIASVARRDAGPVLVLYFAGNDVVRVIDWPGRERFRIFELDLRSKKFVQSGVTMDGYSSVDAAGSSMLVGASGNIVDARTGALRVALPDGSPAWWRGEVMTRDGSVVRIVRSENGQPAQFVHFDRNGRETSRITLPVTHAVISAEIEGRGIVLAGSIAQSPNQDFRSRKRIALLVDPVKGVIAQKAGVMPPFWYPWQSARLPRYAAGTVIFAKDAQDRLVTWKTP